MMETKGKDKQLVANRRYKDTVFRMLFSKKENLLSLYNAVTGREHEDAADLQIVTLENAIYMGMKNDLAFILETNIYLYEHQSTLNPNIPLRDLFYISIEYQKYINNRSLYSSTLQKIPAPKFMVFYNGTDEVEDRVELKLSSAYEHLSGEPDLELKVLMLNVNEGHNKELMEHCKLLQEYARYVAKVREYAVRMDLNDAVECAIEACMKEGVLVDFLRENRSEVKMLSILEYDEEWEKKKLRKAEYEAGVEAGREDGIKVGVECGVVQGEKKKLIIQVCKKLQKGCSVEETAEMLEEDTETIREIYEIAKAYAPEYDAEKICKEYMKHKMPE